MLSVFHLKVVCQCQSNEREKCKKRPQINEYETEEYKEKSVGIKIQGKVDRGKVNRRFLQFLPFLGGKVIFFFEVLLSPLTCLQ
jgi:hypothetical protein